MMGLLEEVMTVAQFDKEQTMIRSALAVLLERAGGSVTYTQSEFAAVQATHGSYRIRGELDKSGPGEPKIVVTLVPVPPPPGTRSDA